MLSLQSLLVVTAIAGAGETVLLHFTADNCVHCRNVAPIVKRLKSDAYPIRTIDVNRSRAWAQNYKVTGVPCFVMIANGEVVDRVDGATSSARLLRMFETANYQAAGKGGAEIRGQSPDQPKSIIPLPGFLKRGNPERETAESPRSLNGSSQAIRQVSQREETPSGSSPQQIANNATVRLKVEDPRGYSFGTGTIIDTHGEEALVLTCGHIFRDSAGKGRIHVDLFVNGTPRTVPGELVMYDAEKTDIGIVAIRPGLKIAAVPVASDGYRLSPGASVFTIGCNNGQPPSLQRSKITHINRYVGPPNVEVAGMPVSGRSGGGLFSSDGTLIGVCNAADDHDNEGIYAALPTVHQALDRINQSRIYQRDAAFLAQNEPQVPTAREASGSRKSRLSSAELTSGGDLEIICIVRSKNNPQGSATLTIDRPSPALVSQLKRESSAQGATSTPFRTTPDDMAKPSTNRPWPRDTGRGGPVVRGQSMD